MSLTMDEIIEKVLNRYDVEDLIEKLDISSVELLNRFEDKFVKRLDDFEDDLEYQELGEDEDENY
jgi:hypothetical protein